MRGCDLQAVVLERLTETWTREEFLDVLDRLNLIVDLLEPPKAEPR